MSSIDLEYHFRASTKKMKASHQSPYSLVRIADISVIYSALQSRKEFIAHFILVKSTPKLPSQNTVLTLYATTNDSR